MLDIKFIRENKSLIKDAARKKHLKFDVDELISVDEQRRTLMKLVEERRSKQNHVTSKIADAIHNGVRETMINEMRELKEDLQRDEGKLKKVMKEWQILMLNVPNLPDMTVPEGTTDEDNQEVRTWGELPQFSFDPKSHVEIMKRWDWIDLDRGAKVAGFRGYYLKNEGVILTNAIWQFVFETFSQKHGFIPVMAPSLVRREAFLGTGYLPQSEDDLYKTQDETYLTGTAEVPMMAYYMDEILSHEDLPIKFLAFSPCFRREAGSYGKDARGIMRVHEFYKHEQVVLCEANHAESVKLHEELTANAEEMMKRLSIPYRVVLNCGGDLGLGQVKKYDIEAWVPSEKKYRETHSSSYFHDFQTRRLNIRYRNAEGELRFVHSLNNTAFATPRLLISIIENCQQADGRIVIPEPLEKYVGAKIIGGTK